MCLSTPPALVIVEDESLIRHLIVRMIQRSFPDQLIYACATSAEAYVYSLHTPIACVLADYVLDIDDGVMLAHTLHTFWPALPIILIAGSAPTAEVRDSANFVAVLPKPIPFATLTTLLQRVLPARLHT